MTRRIRRHHNGKPDVHEFIVTVKQDHFVTVKAVDSDQAACRALKAIVDQFGDGRNPTVAEVERV